ncbi:osmoprotectant update ABC transporter permease/substrate-binding subunit OpuFB [Metabacillus sp. 84]|uniref:osmoprotectant update ABC transporter permease/substrate-binding subunit OpuFB n=1 Tax=unclassified Metabacillus TaxID=2675274 RepID=UPI003CF6A11E
MNALITTFLERQDQLWTALLEHIQISFIALLIAVVITIPLGIFLTRRTKLAEGVIGVTAVLQTIPSLALLGLLIPLVGIGVVPAVIALVIYALLPILRNTYTGIKEVDPSLVEAARGMGMNNRKRLFKVELPLALPVIMAGIRTAMVLIVGTTTLAALIGAGGLGKLILLGIDRNDNMLIILGAIPAALLAILFDVLLRVAEKASTKGMAKKGGIIALIVVLIIAVPLAFGSGKKDLVIAGKLGSEPEILINMYKLLIEQDTDLEVGLKPSLGKTSFLFNALETGEIDIYPEFTGTALSTFLKEQPEGGDEKSVYEQAKNGMEQQYGMAYLEPMAFNNTYTLAVPKDTAEQYDLKAISDLKQVEQNMKVGFTLEFSDRQDGYKGIQELYEIKFPSVTTMEPKLRYAAIESGEVNLIDAYSTDSELEQYDLLTLEDDKGLFPPYQGAPLMKQETLDEYPELEETLNKLAGKITDDEMRNMNYLVNVEGESPEKTAKDFLVKENLIEE